jgi:hypothetical protein
MTDSKREEIIEAKRHLYNLILCLDHHDMTDDDLRIGEALVHDSEIQQILSKASGND